MGAGPLERLVSGAARKPRLTILLVVVAALAGALLALGLRPSTSLSTLVSSGSSDYRATVEDQRQFGGDTVVVLIREPLAQLVGKADLETLSALEACLGGQSLVADVGAGALLPAPAARARPYGGWGGACGKLMRARPAAVVYGPGTFLNRAVAAVRAQLRRTGASARTAIVAAERAARALAIRRHLSPAQVHAAVAAAGRLEAQQLLGTFLSLALATGITSAPSIGNAAFISRIVFAGGGGLGLPNPRFAYLFPSGTAAVIQVRLRATLSGASESAAIRWIRAAVRMPRFRLRHGTYLVAGEPVLLRDLAGQLSGQVAILLVASLVVMALVLLIVFGGPLSLLPLVLALAATAIAFGVATLAGATVTVASVAAVPILIGIAVDYAVQFQSRVREERAGSGAPADVRGAVMRAAGRGGRAIAVAALASAAGFLALLLSPVPAVRGFGLLLVLGVLVALLGTITAAAAALVLLERPGARVGLRRRAGSAMMPSVRGAGELLGIALPPLRRMHVPPLSGILAGLARRPGRVLLVGVVAAAGGWIAAADTPVQSDLTKLVPQNMRALRDLRTLERATGSSGEIDVLVRARDVASPAVVRWMVSYEAAALARFGPGSGRRCAAAVLCPALSLPDLFSAGGGRRAAAGLSRGSIDALLRSVPKYFSAAVITPDRRFASLAFGIRLMPLARQRRVIAYMRTRLRPPRGVRATLAGLPVLAADADGDLASAGRRLLALLVGLVAVGLVLAATLRRRSRTIVPLIPIALASGWSALVVFATRVPLNPMSAMLGALVIAISTEFSVLLSERVHRERGRGGGLLVSLERAYRSTGAAVLASALTAVAGFGVLALSDVAMLRDFGLVTLIDLTVSVAGVLVTLPAALALSERGGRRWPTSAPAQEAGAGAVAGTAVARRRPPARVA